MARRGVCLAILAVVLAAAGTVWRERPAVAQDEGERSGDARGSDRFADLDWLIGEWQGYGRFPGRTSYIHMSFAYDMGGMYLQQQTLDMIPPEDPSTDYETHQDFTVYYQADDNGTLRAKCFDVDGFITTSTVAMTNDSTLVLETTQVENGPPGMKSRVMLTRQDDDQFEEVVELATGGKPYQKVETIEMRRIN